ncbi:hypothetical protein [Sodalis sp. (in: enterobacteria)]|uniref:hypothetical protein n=1 Tax=Sodalis sp. (in: enterobacteria) TaxID=1898979 RepID=UPI003F6886F3
MDALSCKGVVPDSAVITLTDANLLHATRDSKQGVLPTTSWATLVSLLRQPRAIIYDRQQATPALLYVFDRVEGTGKLVMYIDGTLKVRNELNGKREKVNTNLIRTGKILQDLSALRNKKVYDLLWGSLD